MKSFLFKMSGPLLATFGVLTKIGIEGRMISWIYYGLYAQPIAPEDDLIEIIRILSQEVFNVSWILVAPLTVLCNLYLRVEFNSIKTTFGIMIILLWIIIVALVLTGAYRQMPMVYNWIDIVVLTFCSIFILVAALSLISLRYAKNTTELICKLQTIPMLTALVGSTLHLTYFTLAYNRFTDRISALFAIVSVFIGTIMISRYWFKMMRES